MISILDIYIDCVDIDCIDTDIVMVIDIGD